MRSPIEQSLSISLYLPVRRCLLSLTIIFGLYEVGGELQSYAVLTQATTDCIGTSSCHPPSQLGDHVGSPAYGSFHEADAPVAQQTAAGFDPFEPCPATDLLATVKDLRSTENQVCWDPQY
jgi:hypothetical protein